MMTLNTAHDDMVHEGPNDTISDLR